jgi:hypothetical protein
MSKVTAPRHWKSAPDHPKTRLAYITDAEFALLKKLDMHKSGVDKENHYGPKGIPSLNGGGTSPDYDWDGGFGGDYSLGGSLGGTDDDANAPTWEGGGSQIDGTGYDGGWGFDGGGYAGDGTGDSYGDPGGFGLGGGGVSGLSGLGNPIGSGTGLGSPMTGNNGTSPTPPGAGGSLLDEARARVEAAIAARTAPPTSTFGPRADLLGSNIGVPTLGLASDILNPTPEKDQSRVPQEQGFGVSGTTDAMPNVPNPPQYQPTNMDYLRTTPAPAGLALTPGLPGQMQPPQVAGGFAPMPPGIPTSSYFGDINTPRATPPDQTVAQNNLGFPDSGLGEQTNPFQQYGSSGLPPGYASAYGLDQPTQTPGIGRIAGDPRVSYTPIGDLRPPTVDVAAGGPSVAPGQDYDGGPNESPTQDDSMPGSLDEGWNRTQYEIGNLFGGLGAVQGGWQYGPKTAMGGENYIGKGLDDKKNGGGKDDEKPDKPGGGGKGKGRKDWWNRPPMPWVYPQLYKTPYVEVKKFS